MQFTTTRDAEFVRIIGIFNAQRDVMFEFLVQPFAYLPTGQKLAFFAGKRRFVDLESHADGGFIHAQRRQCFWMLPVTQRVRNIQLLDAAEHDDVTGCCAVQTDPFETVEAV